MSEHGITSTLDLLYWELQRVELGGIPKLNSFFLFGATQTCSDNYKAVSRTILIHGTPTSVRKTYPLIVAKYITGVKKNIAQILVWVKSYLRTVKQLQTKPKKLKSEDKII